MNRSLFPRSALVLPLLSLAAAAAPVFAAPPIGVGFGPITPYTIERAAPAGSLVFNGTRGVTVDAPNVTLNATGDWSLFVVTKTPDSSDHTTGTVLSIGTPSDTLFNAAGQINLTWCAGYEDPWNTGAYKYSFVVTGKDDTGAQLSARKPQNGGATFFGKSSVYPLVSEAGLNDRKTHGLVIQCRAGVVEFWGVGPSGARLMDTGPMGGNFKGITNKPLRIGAAQLITQPWWPGTYLGYQITHPVQALVLYNGGCMTTVQMTRLYGGAHAQDVLPLNASRDDRYYPGTITGGVLNELISTSSGVITGALNPGTSLLPAVTDDVIVDLDGNGQVLPRNPFPATSSTARFWGTRVGPATDIRMRVVSWNTSVTTPVIVRDWVTVATNVSNGQSWIGEIPSVPNGFANYDCDISWKDAGGNWTAPKRLNRRWSVGTVVGIAGQSILQFLRDASGTTRTVAPAVNGYIRAYYDLSQNSSGYQDQNQLQGWFNRYTTNTGGNFGETRFAEKLALQTSGPVGVGNFCVGGSPISTYLGNTEKWNRWKHFIQRNRPTFGIWGNGQGDTNLTKAQRFTALDQLLAQYDDAVQTAPGGPWNYTFYVYPMNGDWNNGENIRSYDMQWVASRAAQGKPVAILCYTLDTTTIDGTHLSPNDAGLGTLAFRMAQTIAKGVGAAAFDGLGPKVDRMNSYWKVEGPATTINLAILQNGGTALVTSPETGAPTGFKVSINGGAYAAPASAAILDADEILLTVNTATTTSVSVTYQAGYPGTVGGNGVTRTQAGTNRAVYDTRSDGVVGTAPGFPLEPITGENPLVVPKFVAPVADMFSDDFSDGNSTGWTATPAGQWSVVLDAGNYAFKFDNNWPNTAGSSFTGLATWTNYKLTSDIKITDMPTWSQTDLYARHTDANNYYQAVLADEGGPSWRRVYLKKRVNGVTTTLASAWTTFSGNVWMRAQFQVNGSQLTLKLDGTQLLQATDSSLTAGKIGVGGNKQDILFDHITVTQ